MIQLEVNFRSSMKYLDIGKVAKQSGLQASALRYYEKLGLISSIGRKGLRRQYKHDVLDKLTLITLGRMAGLSLEEISNMFSSQGELTVDRNMLTHKADEIDQTIKKLELISDSMRHVVSCQADNHLDCPSFQKLLKSVKHHPQS